MEVLAFPEGLTPAPLRAQVDVLQDLEWPPPPDVARRGHDPLLDPVTVVLVDGARVVAALDILSRTIAHRGHRYRASGLSAVVTGRAMRGRGFGCRLVSAARALIEGSGADLGIFTCDPALEGFYRAAGWQRLAGTSLIGGTPFEPLPSDALGTVTMAAFLTEHARRHEPDFRHAAIELYPGTIDRLW